MPENKIAKTARNLTARTLAAGDQLAAELGHDEEMTRIMKRIEELMEEKDRQLLQRLER